MEIQFIDITSYRGISSNAEHYYAKYSTDTESIAMCLLTGTETSSHHEELLFFPDRPYAEELCRKDNQYAAGVTDGIHPVTEAQIRHIMENGTIRFPDIPSVVEQARKKWPEAILVFSLRGSQNDFRKWLTKYYEKDKEAGGKVYGLLLDVFRKKKE